jgi:hypothetical protein
MAIAATEGENNPTMTAAKEECTAPIAASYQEENRNGYQKVDQKVTKTMLQMTLIK